MTLYAPLPFTKTSCNTSFRWLLNRLSMMLMLIVIAEWIPTSWTQTEKRSLCGPQISIRDKQQQGEEGGGYGKQLSDWQKVPKKYVHNMGVCECRALNWENRNPAYLNRKSWSLWRQPKNSQVSPNVAPGFSSLSFSLKVKRRMLAVNQY